MKEPCSFKIDYSAISHETNGGPVGLGPCSFQQKNEVPFCSALFISERAFSLD